MPRPLRIELTGGIYHVTARGNERKAIFRDDADREAYLAGLVVCSERYRFSLIAYCLMDNHVHFAIERGPVALSHLMRTVQSSYAQAFNRRHRRVGHLFQGRYKAFLVQDEIHPMALVRYIHMNPVADPNRGCLCPGYRRRAKNWRPLANPSPDEDCPGSDG